MTSAAPPPSTRDHVLWLLKTGGPATAADLAARLGVTPMAVRQHLAALAEEGRVAHEDRAEGVGRPKRVWRPAAVEDPLFPDGHRELTVGLLEDARRAFGAEGMDALIRARTERQVREYAAAMPPPGAPPEERVAALAAVRDREGYMAACSRTDDGRGWLLVEHHCPICTAARACIGLCDGELELFTRVLGDDLTVERTEHLLDGARRCVYEVRSSSDTR